MRWLSAAACVSGLALAVAALSQLLEWRTARAWFLLAWAILLFVVLAALLIHPMRWPAWGLFVGFWGAVCALFLVVLQVLAVAGVLRQPAYGEWVAWPLAVVAIWILVPSALGWGNGTVPRVVDAFGMLSAAGLLSLSAASWIAASDAARVAAGVAAILYSVWAVSLGIVFWRLGSKSDVTMNLQPARVERSSTPT